MTRAKKRRDKVKQRRRQNRQHGRPLQRKTIRYEELEAVLERAKVSLSVADHEQLEGAVETLAYLTQKLEEKGTTLRKLRRILFGSSSEKSKDVLKSEPTAKDGETEGDAGADESGEPSGETSSTASAKETESPTPPKRKPGHGRNGVEAYTGAQVHRYSHGELSHKECCPSCGDGKVYLQKKPRVLVRIEGLGPLSAKVYELERLRCNMCGEVFTADSPDGVGDSKYDESATAMIGLLKYNYGLPFQRIEQLMGNMGVPMPSSTQWELVRDGALLIEPVWQEMIRQAADGDVVYNDDTKARVIELHKELQAKLKAGKSKRSGIFTSCVISTDSKANEFTLFFTGDKHAGENLASVLEQRDSSLSPPIQMCDALSHNTSGDFETLLSNCNAHARRQFVDIAHVFPDACEHVLSVFKSVYKADAEAKTLEMTPEQRLAHHHKHSAPLMQDLDVWLEAQFEERKVEPNSALGKAILYIQEHFEELTLFLRVPGAPLDNNIAERAIKRAIRHRKNSLFYKNKNGAQVGDQWMSVVYTTERAGANVWQYLGALLKNHHAVAQNPGLWMPWNYTEALERARPDPEIETDSTPENI